LGVALRGSSQDIDEFEGELALLSRPSKVFVAVAGEGTGFAVSELDGAGTAVARTSWEAVPAGAVLQLSPHDAVERAIDDPRVEAIVFDPGPERIVVRRSDFARLKLHLPLWPTAPQRVVKP
jgi:hypothetical protein